MLEKFGTDGTRYLLLSAGPFGGDIDVTMERMVEKYNADLANGLGNLVSRVVKLISSEKINYELTSFRGSSDFVLNKFLEKAEFNRLVEFIWERDISEANEFIDKNKPWKLAKEDRKKFEEVMFNLVDKLIIISEKITPLMPEISEKIKKALETKKLDEVLFARIK
jgi:methionyl-tRNA synthetase